MASRKLRILSAVGKPQTITSASETLDFLSLKIGAAGIELKQVSGNLDVGGVKLVNAVGGTASGQVLTWDQIGANNGVAGLDSGGKVPVTQLPNSVMEYKGIYNATTNSPALVDGTGNTGDVYRVTVAGTQDFGSGNLTFVVGDYVIYNGTVWEKAHSGADNVNSVNGQAGVVVLTTTDIAEGTNLYYLASRARTDVLTATIASGDTTHAPTSDAVFTALAAKASSALPFVNDNAGTITVGKIVYVKTNGHVDLARANAAGTCDSELAAVADATILTTATGNCTVAHGQSVTVAGATFTVGDPVFLSPTTAGSVTQTVPSTAGQFIVTLGRAISATVFLFAPEQAEEIVS